MNESIDDLYKAIAQRIVDSIEDDWRKATIDFQYLNDAGKYTGRYFSKSETNEKDFKVGYKSYKDFKKIHEITTENSSNLWNRAKFTLYPSGEFNIDFEWDQSLADEIESSS